MNSKQTSQAKRGNVGRFVFVERVKSRVAKSGGRLIYLRDALFPVVQVEVRLRERSRERISDLVMAILRLLSTGVSESKSLSFLTGLNERHLVVLLQGLADQGTIHYSSDTSRASITALGAISFSNGCMITESSRAMLLCGLTGRPLPTPVYDLPRHALEDLQNKRYLPDWLLAGESSLPLTFLDLSKVENKQRINLPDEASEIVGVVEGSAEPVFLEATMCLSEFDNDKRKFELQLPCDHGLLDWLDADQVLGLIEPLGYALDMTSAEVMNLISGYIKTQGLNVKDASLSPSGNPRFVVDADPQQAVGSKPWMKRDFLNTLSSPQHAVSGMYRLALQTPKSDSPRDVLLGRTLELIAAPDSYLARVVGAFQNLRSRKHTRRYSRETDLDREETLEVERVLVDWDPIELSAWARHWKL